MNTLTELLLSNIVDHPDQPRYGEGDVDSLAASILEVGQLEPIMVVRRLADMPGTFTVLAGHRRTAALRKLDRQTVRAVILEDVDREEAVKAIMASNTAREALTPLEEARGYQTMLELGITPKTIAKVAGRKSTDVERAAKLAGAFTQDQRDELATRPVSLEEYEALARHEDHPEQYKRILSAVGSPNFAWTAQRADEDAKRAEVQAAARAKLEAAGVPIVKHEYSGPQADLSDLLGDDGEKLTTKAHASCPGHAARIFEHATAARDAIAYVCTDWEANGHAHRYRRSGGQTADPMKEQMALDRAWKKRIRATTDLRRDWVRALLAAPVQRPNGGTTIKDNGTYLLQAALHQGFRGDLELVSDLLEITIAKGADGDDMGPAASDHARRDELLKRDPVLAMLALAFAHGDEAVRLSKDPGNKNDWGRDSAVRYLRFLESNGYELSEVELEYVVAAEAPAE